MKFLAKIFGTRNDKLIKQMMPTVSKINDLEKTLVSLTDEELRGKTALFKNRIEQGEPVEKLLPEAFAVCREASKRVLGQRHYDVQLMGGMVLNSGKIAEMKTGEGKTLTATLPSYLRALAGKGSHLVTVNDYLAKRDAEWMGRLYEFLGLSTGYIVHGLNDQQRRAAYHSDITYGTNNEFGFDFLRDNMKTSTERLVQRGFYFAIVDEVDSILIDEARTPLIISGPADTNLEIYKKVNAVIPGVQRDVDYVFDEKSRHVSLTEDGISKMEKRLGIENLYDPQSIEWLHHVQQALKAHVVFKKDVDYVVRDNEIVIVDEFTGRLMPGRRYSDGLHGALEAKEHVRVQQETQTMATITFQNYFRMYGTLSGMTGTADTEAVEFHKIYNLDVVSIPSNRKVVRQDDEDVIYRTAREKYLAIADDIMKAQQLGQPVLVGTVSVEKSELLSGLLTKLKVPHNVLNAKNHASEATIIENAGQKGCVTIATNMAGRGTDIVLGEGVKELGGLYVIGTERHESRRIDNQLRGRSGRQGDPGKSKFFLSLEDDLMRIFASDRLSAIMQRLGMKEGESIISPMVTRAIEKAQRRVEEQNFSSRKNLLEYDDVMNQQRQVVYQRRRDTLFLESDLSFVEDTIQKIIGTIAYNFSPMSQTSEKWDLPGIQRQVSAEFGFLLDTKPLEGKTLSVELIQEQLGKQIFSAYEKKLIPIGPENRKQLECYVYLQVIDQAWKDHLLAMDHLKDSVSLRGYGQRDPLQEYKKEAFHLFEALIYSIEEQSTLMLVRMPAPTLREEAPLEVPEIDSEELHYEHPSISEAQAKEVQKLKEQEEPKRSKRIQKPFIPTFRRDEAKVGRNDVCPCGSGKKYKKCHGVNESFEGEE